MSRPPHPDSDSIRHQLAVLPAADAAKALLEARIQILVDEALTTSRLE